MAVRLGRGVDAGWVQTPDRHPRVAGADRGRIQLRRVSPLARYDRPCHAPGAGCTADSLSSNARQRPLELGDGMIQAKREVAPGAFHLRRYLTADEQREVSWLCLELGSRTAGFYTPVVRG